MKTKGKKIRRSKSIALVLRLIMVFSMAVSSVLLFFQPVEGEGNTAPVLDPIGSQSVDELVQLAFTATATDADIPAQTLTFSLNGTVPSGANITAGGDFTWTPTEAQGPNDYTFDVCVTDDDPEPLNDCGPITVTVHEVNVAPSLDAIGNKSVIGETELSFTATASDEDIPAQTLEFSLSGEPAGASITTGGAFTWTPTEAQSPGTYPFEVCVSDGIVSDCEPITVTVNNNTAPVLTAIGSKNVDELVQLSFTATATDVDLPAQPLTYSLNGQPSGAAITTGGAFTWTPTEAQGPGPYSFDVCVSDSIDDDCENITVTVNEVNVAPELDAIGDKSVTELTLLSFTATAVGYRSAGADPDLQSGRHGAQRREYHTWRFVHLDAHGFAGAG